MAAASSGTAKMTLPADDQILITREFDAPKHLVYKAVHHAGAGQAVVERSPRLGDERRDRPAGRRPVALRDGATGGFEVAFHGEFRELVPDERIVTTEVYEGVPGGDENPAVNLVTFTEAGGRTTLEVLVQCPSKEVRDMIIDSGMEGGMQEAYDELEQVAISLGSTLPVPRKAARAAFSASGRLAAAEIREHGEDTAIRLLAAVMPSASKMLVTWRSIARSDRNMRRAMPRLVAPAAIWASTSRSRSESSSKTGLRRSRAISRVTTSVSSTEPHPRRRAPPR